MMLAEQIQALRRGEVTSVALVSAALEAAQRWQGSINAFISIESEQAMLAAAASDTRRDMGQVASALDGVPLALKDMFDRVGHRCSFGSRIPQIRSPNIAATVVRRLQNAGAIIIGSLNMAEFALGPTGHNVVFGHCRNPWDTARIAGGSSSGAAAAVAAGIVAGAIGSDTGGSIRIPAAACGVVGLKPTQGCVDAAGAMPLAPSLDCIGPVAASAADCAVLFDFMAGSAVADATPTRSLDSVRIAMASEEVLRQFDPQIAAAVEQAARELESRGAKLSIARLPDLSRLHELANVIQQMEAARAHAERLRMHSSLYTPHIRGRIEPGLAVPESTYLHAIEQRAIHCQAFVAETLGGAEALLLPVLGMLTPRIDQTDEAMPGSSPEIVGQLTRWTRWVNYLGVPSLSLACGVDGNGMPIGMQLIGRPHAEITLLNIAQRYQEGTAWHARRPGLPGE